MRWLILGLLVSLGALLWAAAGMARHIWLQRARFHSEPQPPADRAEEADFELEH